MRKDTRARAIPKAVKQAVRQRDSLEGWPCCVFCGMPAPEDSEVWSNAHFISRAQGGLGVEENILTLCPDCHRRYDHSTAREEMRERLREYLAERYKGWDEAKLYYRRRQ